MHINDLINAINQGTYDANIESLKAAVLGRIKDKAPSVYSFQPGQRVFLNSSVRPAYLIGAEATIVRLKQKKVVIRLKNPVPRFQGEVTCPTSFLRTA